ncbi:MAG: cyanophycinase [Candidatus Eremiobacteraeota bacterium]|nr:cyanophycinase [Candidatus Eremiobacteraeota bacterium]
MEISRVEQSIQWHQAGASTPQPGGGDELLAGKDTVEIKNSARAPAEKKVIDGITTYLTGSRKDVTTPAEPGLCLMGGSTEVDGAMRWMIKKSGGGDFVVIRATDSSDYNDYIYRELGGVDSVETLVIDSREKADSAYTAETIRNAEALFIAGGDQWNYYKYWNGTKVEDAINHLAGEKKVPIGGTSAGCHSMAGLFYSAENDGVTSCEALQNPFHEKVTLRADFLAMPGMTHVITDSHFHKRDRMGRSATFLARMIEERYPQDPEKPRVIALDEKAAVTVEADGTGKIWSGSENDKEGCAYFLSAHGRPQVLRENTPLTFSENRLEVYKIRGSKEGQGHFRVLDDGSLGDFEGGGAHPVNIKNGLFEKDPY